MGVESILKALASAQTSLEKPDLAGEVALPKGDADPRAEAEFTRYMQEPIEGLSSGTGTDPAETPVECLPGTLGQRCEVSRPGEGAEQSQVGQWLDSAMDILSKDSVSHADLFRVQVLAGLAQVEVHRNNAVSSSLDNSLKTLIKNT